MTMKLILLASAVLSVLGAIWIFVVIPAERREHERRLELVQKKLERHAAQKDEAGSSGTERAEENG